MEPVESKIQTTLRSKLRSKKKSAKAQSGYHRIYINDESNKKVADIVEQVNEKFSGMVRITKKEIVNFLIEKSSAKLSDSDLKVLQERHLTDLQKAKWVVMQLEKSQCGEQSLTFEDLVTQTTNKKSIRRKRRKSEPKEASQCSHSPGLTNSTQQSNGGEN